MLGFSSKPFQRHPLGVQMVEHRSQYVLRYLAAPLQGMLAGHQDFRLDDGNQSGFLAQCGIASQRLQRWPRCNPGSECHPPSVITARHLAKRAPI